MRIKQLLKFLTQRRGKEEEELGQALNLVILFSVKDAVGVQESTGANLHILFLSLLQLQPRIPIFHPPASYSWAEFR